MSDAHTLEKIAELKDIPADRVEKVKAIIEAKKLNKDEVRKKSSAAGGLMEWVEKCCM